MNYKKNLFPLVLCILSFSCETDNIEPTYPSTYYKSGLRITNDLRIFSSRGEIKANSIIRKYSEIDTSSYNRFAEYIKNDVGIIDTIKFLGNENAIVNHYFESNHYLVRRKNKMLILTSADTITKCCTFYEVITRSLPYYIGQIKPEVYSEFIQSSVRGFYNFGFTGREKFIVEQSGNELTAPIINFTLHSGNSSFDFVNNILQPDFYKYLSVGDTLTLKEYRILYRIK